MELSHQLHNPGVSSPGTHWKGGWVGPRAGLKVVVKIKKKASSLPLPGIKPGCPDRSLVTTDWATRTAYGLHMTSLKTMK